MLKYLSVIACALFMFAACKKADTPASRQEELRGGKWRMSGGNVRFDFYNVKDTTISYNVYLGLIGDTCKADDYLVFLENYDGQQYSNVMPCSFSDPEFVQFRWQLFDDDKGIYFLNANETFLRKSTIKADFVNYSIGRFTIKYAFYDTSFVDKTKWDTTTFTQTFIKY